jgi:hypothetical protein|tara:strand:- start:241 stop:891 length:651 start_codon:yes stop_codon:yes gene_type:complete
MYKNNLQDPKVINYLNSPIKRYDIINYLIKKYNFINYLEIGVFKGENIRMVKAIHKDGVDPGVEGYTPQEVNYPMTSNEFFNLIKGHNIKYDIVFIDGLHEYSQVKKDIENSLNHLQSYGYIVLHDCNPVSYESQLSNRQTIAWNGDVWKAFVEFKQNNPNFESGVVDTDFGVGWIKNKNSKLNPTPLINMDYNHFDTNRKELLNLINWDEFKTNY